MKVGGYWLAWLACSLYIALHALDVFLAARTTPDLVLGTAINDALALPFPLAGVLLVARRPAHPIGWLLCAAWLLLLLAFIGFRYAQYVLVGEPGALAGGVVAAWLGAWFERLGLGL